MATVAPPADQAANLLQKLSLDTESKNVETHEPAKKNSTNACGAVDFGNATSGQIPSYERSVTPLLTDYMDASMCYMPNAYTSPTYYYPGFESGGTDWEGYPRFINSEGVDINSGVYGDNGSVMYHGYGYAPYSPYSPAGSPVPPMGNDGQLYGHQQYQYPTYFPPLTPNSVPYAPNPTTAVKGETPTSVGADQKPSSGEAVDANSNGVASGGSLKGNNGSAPLKPSYPKTSFNSNVSCGSEIFPGGIPAPGYKDPRFGIDGLQSPIPLEAPVFSDGRPRPTGAALNSSVSNANSIASKNHYFRPNSHYMGLQHSRPMSGIGAAHGYVNRIYPNKLYGQYGSAFGSGMSFGSNGFGMRTNGRAWTAVESKNKPRGRGNGFHGYGNENVDGFNELNRGPRAKGAKNLKGFATAIMAVKGQALPLSVTNNEKDMIPDREQYNLPDFPDKYVDAKFFIVKSYSEDDVHKSIKYNVWASTPNGNKKLDAAYREAQEKSGACPVFLFFSVNTSGQFVGLAEMVGPVDFDENCEYWQQDKWNGSFPLKWHIVKDVPNSLLRHITLENNENKPVTNSRDTQEVKLDPGVKMIKIFKEHVSKTCILDDFGFYENRQRSIQEKKVRQRQFQKQVFEVKPTNEKKEAVNGGLKLQNSVELVSGLGKETSLTAQSDGDLKLAVIGAVANAKDGSKAA